MLNENLNMLQHKQPMVSHTMRILEKLVFNFSVECNLQIRNI